MDVSGIAATITPNRRRCRLSSVTGAKASRGTPRDMAAGAHHCQENQPPGTTTTGLSPMIRQSKEGKTRVRVEPPLPGPQHAGTSFSRMSCARDFLEI